MTESYNQRPTFTSRQSSLDEEPIEPLQKSSRSLTLSCDSDIQSIQTALSGYGKAVKYFENEEHSIEECWKRFNTLIQGAELPSNAFTDSKSPSGYVMSSTEDNRSRLLKSWILPGKGFKQEHLIRILDGVHAIRYGELGDELTFTYDARVKREENKVRDEEYLRGQ